MKENIEEVVERLEKSINDVWFSTTYTQEDEERDLRVLLSDYKRVLKENEELKEKWDKDTHKLQNDLDIANAERIDWEKAYQEEKDKQFDLLRENQKLNEYIILAPNLDEMTAMKYRNITEEAYIKGRAEEQQKAEQIIYEHYISKQKVKDIIEKLIKDNTENNESVKRFEEIRRNTSDSFYKKSYQTSIHKLNAQIEARKHIINILQELLESEG